MYKQILILALSAHITCNATESIASPAAGTKKYSLNDLVREPRSSTRKQWFYLTLRSMLLTSQLAHNESWELTATGDREFLCDISPSHRPRMRTLRADLRTCKKMLVPTHGCPPRSGCQTYAFYTFTIDICEGDRFTRQLYLLHINTCGLMTLFLKNDGSEIALVKDPVAAVERIDEEAVRDITFTACLWFGESSKQRICLHDLIRIKGSAAPLVRFHFAQ